ncbi:outer membrane lipid asymmetry maintenance protein MlaD [Thorsellia kenyensis]|uniref:Outer membrane lipid asymmetry maintenance protein MlaD n=1 Tax=Thorsellia kenyensis TaxID=1549888 RepID=A0ABV6C6R5_9GAMM
MKKIKLEVFVGLFILLGFLSLMFLLFNVADVKNFKHQGAYKLYAHFDNIGSLKVKSPIKIGGVVIGRITDIALDDKLLIPLVTMEIESQYNKIPNSSSLAVRSAGLLGEQFLALNLGIHDPDLFDTYYLTDGKWIEDTKSAIVLEDIIGQIVYSLKGEGKSEPTADEKSSELNEPIPNSLD